jgi:hypothetical protein
MSFRKQKPEGELIYKRVPVPVVMTPKEIYQTIKEKPYRDGEALITAYAENAYWAGFRAGSTASMFCKCSKEEKHGSTSAMHCNHCGGVEPSETWLKPGMNQIE